MISQFYEAPCTTVDPETFFPDPTDRKGVAQAKAVCATCPLTEKCLNYAYAERIKFGIFGGLTAEERDHRKMLQWKANYRARMRAKGVSV